MTVGTFLGVWNGRSLVVGALCDVSLHKHADGQQAEPATGKVDLLGELILDTPGAGYFPARRHELSQDRQRHRARRS